MVLNNFLDRTQRKLIGGFLITLGLLMGIPFSFTPDDFLLNIPLAKLISQYSNISIFIAILLTYTIIPIILIWIGIKIFPAHSQHVEKAKNRAFGYFHSFRFRMTTDKNLHFKLTAFLIAIYLFFQWYSNYIFTMVGVV